MQSKNNLCSHYLNLSFSENFLNDVDTKIQIQLPYPLNKPLKGPIVDKVQEFHKNLEKYKKKLSAFSRDFPAVKSTILRQNYTDSHATISKGLLDVCENKFESPFPCDYNPYYATGILEYVNFKGEEYLIRPDSKKNLRITDLSRPRKNRKLHIEQQYDADITGISSYNISGTINILSKHKNESNLLRIQDVDDSIEISFNKKFKRDIIDAKINSTNIGYVFPNGKIQIYDIESFQKIDVNPFNIDSATKLEFIDGNYVGILSQKNLKILDLRSNESKSFEPELNTCDYLSCVKIDNDLINLGSRHNLIQTDMRFSKNVEFCTHLMKRSPVYIDKSGEFLILSGQKTDQKVIFHNNSLPINVPSILDTFKKCQLERDILLRYEIDDRVEKSLAGVKLISRDNEPYLYTVNCLGDIFKQKITDTDDQDPVEIFYKFVDHLPKIRTPLRLTNVTNASEVRFTLNKRIKHQWLAKYTAETKKKNYFLNHFNNKYQKDKLSELAANFAAIWDEDEEEEREDVVVPEVAPLDKVSDWIESNYFFD